MRSMLFAWALVACAIFSGPAQAGTNTWTAVGYAGCASVSLAAAQSCMLAQHGGSPCWAAGGIDGTPSGPLMGSGPGYTYVVRGHSLASRGPSCFNDNAAGTFSFTEACDMGSTWDAEFGGCYSPPDCDDFAGVTGNVFFTGSVDGGPVCATPPGEEVIGCEALVANPSGVRYGVDGLAYARLSFTGDQCDGETDLTAEVVVDGPGSNNCISGGGVTLCATESSQNCGTVNGEQVCFTSAPSGTCTFLGNGGMVCAADASSPPAPTEEDGETAATPTASFSAGGNDRAQGTFNYFGPGAVASSGSPTSGEGPPGELGGEEDDEGGEETDCGPGCTLELPEVEDGEEAGSVLTSAISALEAGTLGDVLDEIRPTLSAGECPTASFEAWDQTFTFDSHCDFMESQRTVLAAMMLLVWSLLAFRILMET